MRKSARMLLVGAALMAAPAAASAGSLSPMSAATGLANAVQQMSARGPAVLAASAREAGRTLRPRVGNRKAPTYAEGEACELAQAQDGADRAAEPAVDPSL